jgi:ATP-dependent Clp protease ATP-binding subunit ClpA
VFEQFTVGARTAVSRAVDEARLRGDRRIGTEHLLLGILHEPRSAATRALGIDLKAARTALDVLDQSALTAIGIHIHGVERPAIPAFRKRAPFTSAARSAIPRAVAEAKKAGSRRISPEHLLLAILDSEEPDPAAEVLEQLGIDRPAIRERVRHSLH